nr:hypothetical protein CFP56_11328 [Quercus suber]
MTANHGHDLSNACVKSLVTTRNILRLPDPSCHPSLALSQLQSSSLRLDPFSPPRHLRHSPDHGPSRDCQCLSNGVPETSA